MTRFGKKLGSVGVVLLLCSAAMVAQSPVPTNPEIEARVNAMIAKMSLEDKLTLLGGEDTFYTPAIPSIGLKRLKMSDGPVGVRTFGPSTAYTAGVALAASWDPALAERVGQSLGNDARARGVNFLLAPGVNIYRSPLNGRNMEYFGEDPYLAGRMVVGYIDGVQSKGVSATVKHFAANNSEYDRHNINAVVDERTLREIYLPAFEAAVTKAHVGAVMDSYNLVNGEHSTQNSHLNIDILRNEWKFPGVLMSDWDATYDGVAAANGGLDLEMPYAKLMMPETLKAALQDGRLKEATIDEKIRRILRTAAQFGWLDREQADTSIPLYNLAGDRVALDESRESITLLKNEGHVLPLDAAKMKTIAIVGPMAASAVVGGGGSSKTTPFNAPSFVAEFASYLGERVKVMYVDGVPSLQDLVHQTPFRKLSMEIRVGSKTASPVTTHIARMDYWARDGRTTWPETAKTTFYRWKGEFVAHSTEDYLLSVGSGDTDAYRVLVDGKEVLAHHGVKGSRELGKAVLKLTANQPAAVEIEYTTRSGAPHVGVALIARSEMLSPASKQVLRQADAALVTVGFDFETEGEGFDRTYALPLLQNELIEAVAALNPKTVVALTAGGAVETEPWLGAVPALLHLYYPGQEGARALAEVVFGERSPEGHLPFSWERVLSDNPTMSHYFEEGEGGKDSHYAEGLFVGYRYYTSMKKQPLFPFGMGLSYTTFSYGNLAVKRNSDTDVEVSFDVKNTGDREGASVAQVYVGDPSATVKRPVMELKQFAKVRLKPGAKEHVVLHLDRRAFEYFDTVSKGWKLDPGMFTIYAGQSSESVDLQSDVRMF